MSIYYKIWSTWAGRFLPRPNVAKNWSHLVTVTPPPKNVLNLRCYSLTTTDEMRRMYSVEKEGQQ